MMGTCGYRPYIPGRVIVCPCCIRSLICVFVEIVVVVPVVAFLLFPRHEFGVSFVVDTGFLLRLPDLVFVFVLNFLHNVHHITVRSAGSY